MEIFIVRHGESEANRDRIIQVRIIKDPGFLRHFSYIL